MDHRHLGRTGLLVSPVAFGTMNFGPVTPAVDAHAIMDWALDHGVTLFDTADVYGADREPHHRRRLTAEGPHRGDHR
jgi:NDP-hexose C3-ketoreductase / dTDP-4-oxo-2-deoxy-alpha-D-pentos-2-ene 2,3-reductase